MRKIIRNFLTLTCLLIVTAPELVRADDPPINTMPVRRWIEKQADVDAFYSEFEQERRLRALKDPLVNRGKIWYRAPGSFRWEIGEPPETIAVQRARGDLIILNPEKREAKRYTAEAMREDAGARGASFLEVGFPKSWEEFDRLFKLTEVTLENGIWHATVSVRDRRTAVALRKIVFYIDAETFALRGFYLRFRDSSSITTRLLRTVTNPPIDDARFNVDLTGYEVDVEQAG